MAKTKMIKEAKNKQPYGNKKESNLDVVSIMEKEYPKMMDEFKRIQQEQYQLFAVKQHDYGPHNISMGTELRNEKEIKLALTALTVRINDKVNRLVNLIIRRDSEGQAEPVEDAFADLSVYGIIARIVINGKWGK